MLSIIIVNYKTPELTLRCIQSIYDTAHVPFEIIVVDNNSEDNSEETITLHYPSVVWINSPENSGFGRGNNLGAKYAKGDFFLFLNSDMLLKEGAIEQCITQLQTDVKIGVLGCLLRNEDGSIQKSTYNYIGDFQAVLKKNIPIERLFTFNEPPIKAVMGAYMLIPRLVFKEVNGFDTDFFMYAEELELCHRIQQKGYTISFNPNVEAIHKHGGSSSGSNWSGKQNFLSNSLLYLKIKGRWGYFWYHILSIFTYFCNFLFLWKMDKGYRKAYWEEINYYFSNFFTYWVIPFYYSKKQNSGTNFLRRF